MKAKVGDIVKFKHPANPKEETARFVVVEEGNKMGRIKIQLICDLPFPPIELVGEGDVKNEYSENSQSLG